MAEHVGIDRGFISDLENGKKEICLRNLEVIAAAFDMTLNDFSRGNSSARLSNVGI